jgi:hypothetical protein
LQYRTAFRPNETAVDIFYANDGAWATVSNILYKYYKGTWTAESRNGNHDWGDYGGQAYRVLDDNRNTGWHSNAGSQLPQCLVVDMKELISIDYLVLWHLSEGLANNWIYFKDIEVYLSDTPVTPDVYQSSWGDPVAVYRWPGGFDGINIGLKPNSRGRYLVLYFPTSTTSTYISFAELDVYR